MTNPGFDSPTAFVSPARRLPEPFDMVRARTLVWWGGAWFVGLAFLVAFGASINLLVYTLYPVLLMWVLYECDRAKPSHVPFCNS